MDFGFKLSPSSAVNLDTVDTRRYDRLVQLEPDALTCIGFFRRVSADDFKTAVEATCHQAALLSSALGYRKNEK